MHGSTRNRFAPSPPYAGLKCVPQHSTTFKTLEPCAPRKLNAGSCSSIEEATNPPHIRRSLWLKLLRSESLLYILLSLQYRKGVAVTCVWITEGKIGIMRGAPLLLSLAQGGRSANAAKAFTTELPAAPQSGRCFTSIPAGTGTQIFVRRSATLD